MALITSRCVSSSATPDGCVEGLWAVCLGFVATLVVSGLSVSGFVRQAANGAGAQNGIFQSGVVAAYGAHRTSRPSSRGKCHLYRFS